MQYIHNHYHTTAEPCPTHKIYSLQQQNSRSSGGHGWGVACGHIKAFSPHIKGILHWRHAGQTCLTYASVGRIKSKFVWNFSFTCMSPQFFRIEGRLRAKLGVFYQHIMATLDLFVLKEGEDGARREHSTISPNKQTGVNVGDSYVIPCSQQQSLLHPLQLHLQKITSWNSCE